MSKQPHVIILGLGITGSSIAAAIAAKGFSVTGIEQFGFTHERGSSHGDTRIFRRVPHEGQLYLGMATVSWDGWRAWNKLAGDELFVPCGGVDAGPADSPMVLSAERLCREHNEPWEIMTSVTFNKRYPHFKLPADWRIVYQQRSGFVKPDATRAFLHGVARARGAKLVPNVRVTRIEPLSHGVRVHTANETLTCDILVIAAGGWLPELIPEVGRSLSIERRVNAWYQPLQREDLSDGRLPVFCLDADGGWYGTPTGSGTLKIGHDKHFNQKIDPDEPGSPPDQLDAARLNSCLRKYFTGFLQEPSALKQCIYTLANGHNFIIDRLPDHPDILIFSCCSGHGFKYAPAYGEIAVDLLANKERPDLDPLRLNRRPVATTSFSD